MPFRYVQSNPFEIQRKMWIRVNLLFHSMQDLNNRIEYTTTATTTTAHRSSNKEKKTTKSPKILLQPIINQENDSTARYTPRHRDSAARIQASDPLITVHRFECPHECWAGDLHLRSARSCELDLGSGPQLLGGLHRTFHGVGWEERKVERRACTCS